MRNASDPAARDPQPVRDAASVILLRGTGRRPQVLMGQRGAGAAFMPDKFVFPGGAVDPSDFGLIPDPPPDPETARRLALDTEPNLARALPFAAIRELWEETGLRLGHSARAPAPAETPAAWRGFLDAGLAPNCAALRFVFRAITPPGRPRRFDARFFLADAACLAEGGQDFAATDGELRRLQWLDLAAARALALPFITEVVLSEIEALLAAPDPARPVPFFHHTAAGAHFRAL